MMGVAAKSSSAIRSPGSPGHYRGARIIGGRASSGDAGHPNRDGEQGRVQQTADVLPNPARSLRETPDRPRRSSVPV